MNDAQSEDCYWFACRDCQQEFVVEANEARWYAGMSYPLPRRCRSCRAYRRAERERQDEGAA